MTYMRDLIYFTQEADNEGDGTIHLDEFVLIFKQLFAVNDEVMNIYTAYNNNYCVVM